MKSPNKPASPTPNCDGRFARRRSLARAAVNVSHMKIHTVKTTCGLARALLIMVLMVLPIYTWAAEQRCGPFDGLQLPNDSLDILKGGEVVRSHSEWLKKYTPDERESYDARKDSLRANLCGAIAVGRSFFVLELDWADLSKSDLQNSNFNGASLEHANFSGANLQNAQFVGT